MSSKEYKLSIDPRILELLGPSLYTNIYYILAELIANAYDADSKNVYIISNKDDITVEDDGSGMSYSNGEVQKFLNVAAISRNSETNSITNLGRRKMGRKGVGKLAALSVSNEVYVKTISGGDKSGFILSRVIGEDNLLYPLNDNEITFEKITSHGTAIVMKNPQYRLHSTLEAIKRNLLKIFPLVDKDFVIHIIRNNEHVIIDKFDKEMISQISTLIVLGDEFSYLKEYFSTPFTNDIDNLLKINPIKNLPVEMKDEFGESHAYNLEIKGWIGTYLTTRGRKVEVTDFPDNFISLYANNKMGEFNILPAVGQNKLNEVFVVGQLHIDLFELTELPDMALSNRQGFKSEDPRYQAVRGYVRDVLLPSILKMRDVFVSLSKNKKREKINNDIRNDEEKFRNAVDTFRINTSENAASKISKKFGFSTEKQTIDIIEILKEEINSNSPIMGIKSKVDNQKKKILISQTFLDKDLADTIYNMLIYNNVPSEDIIYTNCDDEVCRIPEGEAGKSAVYDYLRDFFVNSYSTQKIYVIFITSYESKNSWGALTEVGAAWITQVDHKIFNIKDFRPEHPLDDDNQWHNSERDETKSLCMTKLSCDIFCQKIEHICDQIGYSKKTRSDNNSRLQTLIKVKENY